MHREGGSYHWDQVPGQERTYSPSWTNREEKKEGRKRNTISGRRKREVDERSMSMEKRRKRGGRENARFYTKNFADRPWRSYLYRRRKFVDNSLNGHLVIRFVRQFAAILRYM